MTRHREGLSRLLEQARLSQNEVSERLRLALDSTYWEKLNPHLSINAGNAGDNIETIAIGAEAQADLQKKFAKQGYFKIDALLSQAAVERLKTGIEVLKSAGWPPAFSFVYDQFWLATRTLSFVQLMSAILGPDYKQSCHLWSHYVYPRRGARGWPPHVDNPDRPNRLTVWIALNDATLDNGCLYLIPKDLVPKTLVENFVGQETCSRADLMAMLQSAEALPVSAGTVLGWQHEVIHWGSYHRAEEKNPRISISQEFIGASMTPKKDELPLFAAQSGLPSFEQRLYAIGTGILAYQRVETLLIRYSELAERLVAATRSSV